MTRDKLIANQRLARSVLWTGAGVYFLACAPLYGRRGFPEVDPFWLACVWLWIPPVALSAIYDRFDRMRIKHLLAYTLATAFIVSWGKINVVPSHKNPFEAALEALLAGVLLVEGTIRFLLSYLRTFFTHPHCEQCGYYLHGLTEPRCPECGTPFAVEQLDPSYSPTPTPVLRRRTTLFIAVILLLAVAWPIAYRHYTFVSLAISGSERAEKDWANGQAKWFVSRAELEAMWPEQQARFGSLVHQTDPSSRLEINVLWPDWESRTWQTSYRETIERKLRQAGRPRPSFD